ncbi:hypothetical protein BDN67DRAFT_983382 [Paxillus ammoniavirescens]|nr:hypothetical protein BDN67DRAFT_983382 [Paxillus ammoniavirescens]
MGNITSKLLIDCLVTLIQPYLKRKSDDDSTDHAVAKRQCLATPPSTPERPHPLHPREAASPQTQVGRRFSQSPGHKMPVFGDPPLHSREAACERIYPASPQTQVGQRFSQSPGHKTPVFGDPPLHSREAASPQMQVGRRFSQSPGCKTPAYVDCTGGGDL